MDVMPDLTSHTKRSVRTENKVGGGGSFSCLFLKAVIQYNKGRLASSNWQQAICEGKKVEDILLRDFIKSCSECLCEKFRPSL